MDYTIYKIKKGDTLEKIAYSLGISVDELRSCHNNHCELHQLIGDKLPKNLSQLLVPLLSRQKKSENISILTFGGNSRYKITIHNYLYIKNELATENLTESLWDIEEQDKTLILTAGEQKILKCDSQFRDLMEVISQVNRATRILSLTLGEDQSFGRVANSAQIIQEWEKIKFEDLKNPAVTGFFYRPFG